MVAVNRVVDNKKASTLGRRDTVRSFRQDLSISSALHPEWGRIHAD